MPASPSPAPPPLPPHEVIRNRWLGFLIWQAVAGAAFHLFSSILLRRRPALFAALFSLLPAYIALLLLSLAFLLLLSVPSVSASYALSALAAIVFVAAGTIAVPAACAIENDALGSVALRGAVLGFAFSFHFLYRKRLELVFPPIQRPAFYSFKRGLPQSCNSALKISVMAYMAASTVLFFLADRFSTEGSVGSHVLREIRIFIGTFLVSLCWQVSHHLLQVLHTKRHIFVFRQGSAAVEANPSEVLLEALEQSAGRSHLQYLAYLDLCMLSENNLDWRCAAIFEETGETYRRVINACLRPVEMLTSKLAEALEVLSSEKPKILPHQTLDRHLHSMLSDAFIDIQICAWSARSMAALTARSRQEDRYGVAQLTGRNPAVMSTLLSAILAVEACLGKKTNPQATHILSAANNAFNTHRKDVIPTNVMRMRDELQCKAYKVADILRTSIYQILSAFRPDLASNARADSLERIWIAEGNPLYGSRAALLHKLNQFLQYQAV